MTDTLFSIALAILAVCIAAGLLIGESVHNLIAIYWCVLAVKNGLVFRRKDKFDPY